MKRILFPIAALTLTLSTLVAADPTPGPNARIKELKPLEGRWSCQGTAFAFMGMPEHKTTATFEATWALNDYWLQASFREARTATNSAPVEVRYFWGWDDQTKKFASIGVDNGGAHFVHTSPGWDGDKITFDGELRIGGKTMKFHDVFTKMSGSKLMHKGEAEIDGKWTKLDEETCTK
jgi:hypothetical protein